MSLRRIVVLAAALLAAVPGPAPEAAPIPGPRPPVEAGPHRAARAARLDEVCATPRVSAALALEAHVARGALTPLAVTHSTDAGEIAVLEDDGTFFFDQAADGSRRTMDVAAVARAFYRTHGDDYDQLAIYAASGVNTWLGSATALAASYVVRNPTAGIGLDTFDLGREFGSAFRLECALVMNGLHRYENDPHAPIGVDQFTPMDFLAHEMGHRWLSYIWVDSAGTPSDALLGRSRAHWSFLADVDASVMEGCSWAVIEPDSFRTDSVTTGFGALDLYLMGLASKAETPPILTVYDGHSWNPPGTYGKVAYPQVGVGCRGRAVHWTVDDIERLNGPRVPAAAQAPHHFRIAFVLVTPRGQAATAADLDKLESFRQAYGPYFAYATRGRGTVDLTLDSQAGRVVIGHEPLPDTEDVAASRTVGARVTIAQAGIPLAVDPASVRLHWRAGGGWNEVPMSAAGADSFHASIPGPGAPATVEYFIAAASDSAGIGATHPAAGAAAPHSCEAGPDGEAPRVLHVPVREQGWDRMPQNLLARVTDNTGVDSVWIEFRRNGGALQSAATTVAGRDSFQVALGSLGEGQWMAYRFVARDVAAAANVAWSNPAWDTMRVGEDWRLDLENGPEGMTTDGVGTLRRRLWHLSTQWSSPAGGTSWKFGATDSVPYAPFAGGYLYVPFVARVEPGTLLRFDHRYGFEESSADRAWDGGFLEARGPDNVWRTLHPASGYTHTFRPQSPPFPPNGPCWSGRSSGWKAEVFDLSVLAPGPAILRFLALTDNFQGDEGWWIDHLRIEYPDGTVTGVEPAAALAPAAAWPNPARAELRQRVSTSAAAEVEWTLYDLQGRKVAPLWRGRVPAGGLELAAVIPHGVPAGLYFTRLIVDGRLARNDRIALVK